MKGGMKRIGRQLGVLCRGCGFALLLASLLVGLFPMPGLAVSVARAAVPLAPAGTPEEEKRDGDEKENAPVGHPGGRSRKPCRHEVIRVAPSFRSPAGCAPGASPPSCPASPASGTCSVLRC